MTTPSPDELAAIVAALALHAGSDADERATQEHSPWKAAARLEALGNERCSARF